MEEFFYLLSWWDFFSSFFPDFVSLVFSLAVLMKIYLVGFSASPRIDRTHF